ncbi:MAG: tail fiber domain-containing protein [bacterium]|nr:tail fiber domain-containing protein [bacterium]
MYGIAWTHSNIGGQSKAGLSHQALFVEAGVTKTAIGTGIWTSGVITGTSNLAISGTITSGLINGQTITSAANFTGTVTSSGAITNSAPSQGNISLSGLLPGYPDNTYPTLKTSGAYLYFSANGVYSGYWYGNSLYVNGSFNGAGTGLTGTAASLTAGAVSSITSGQVTTALGFTPYNSTNPSGYITSAGTAAAIINFTSNPNRTDGNDYSLAGRTQGIYAISGAGLNGPGPAYLNLIHAANGTDVAFQIAGGYVSDNMYFRGTSALQNGTGYSAWRTVLHNGNFNSYAPTLTGTGASGTWGISITGTISAANTSAGAFGSNTGGGNYSFPGTVTAATSVTAPSLAVTSNSQFMAGNVANNIKLKGGSTSATGITGYDSADVWRWQLYGDGTNYGFLNGNWAGWDMMKTVGGALLLNGSQTVLHSGNYNSYAPTLTGTGASGTWGISITGTISAANTSAGAFGSNTGGGNYTFPSGLTVNGAITGPGYASMPLVAGGGNSWYGFGTSDASGGASIAGGYYPYAINNHTGLAFSAHSSYGGIRFYNQNYPTAPMTATPIMQITDGVVYINSNVNFPGSGIWNSSGNVGIGTAVPSALFTIQAPAMSAGSYASPAIRLLQTAQTNYSIDMGIDNLVHGGLFINTQNAGVIANAVTIRRDNGNVGIGTTGPSEKLHVVGNVSASAFLYSSDESLKTNIKTIPNALSNVLNLRGVEFNWKENGAKSIGVIAQEVEKVYPEIVGVDSQTGLKSVDYGKLVGPLIEAIKEQQTKIGELENEIQKLKNK